MSQSALRAWYDTVDHLLTQGEPVSPRGRLTVEQLHRTISIDLRRPVVTASARKLSYQFMAAEAYWILTGDNTTQGIVPWNQHIGQFSDDGKTFFGAYGPRILSQLDYVVGALMLDPDTRQAALTIWRENPPATKDMPCTVAMSFSLRQGVLHQHVFMRSSDAWLGLPYDLFNFSMVAHYVAAQLNYARLANYAAEGRTEVGETDLVQLGELHLTMASSHLYEVNHQAAIEASLVETQDDQPLTPINLLMNPATVLTTLAALRDSKPGDPLRWWEVR
jgi:hypothetical protein